MFCTLTSLFAAARSFCDQLTSSRPHHQQVTARCHLDLCMLPLIYRVLIRRLSSVILNTLFIWKWKLNLNILLYIFPVNIKSSESVSSDAPSRNSWELFSSSYTQDVLLRSVISYLLLMSTSFLQIYAEATFPIFKLSTIVAAWMSASLFYSG